MAAITVVKERRSESVLTPPVIPKVGWIRRHDWPKPVLATLAALVLLFTYGPLIIIALLSVGRTTLAAFPLRGLTTKWYVQMFHDPQVWMAARTTIIIAVGALVLSTMIGLPVAIAAHKRNFRGKGVIKNAVYMPVVLPGLLNGFVLLNYLVLLHLPLGIYAVVIVHGTVLSAVMFSMTYARLVRLDPSLEEAAMDLGATPRQVFRKVTLPTLRVALVGGWLLVFLLSLDDLLAAYFLLGQGYNIQMLIWSRLRVSLSPELEALGTTIFVFSVVVVISYSLLMERERRQEITR